jgi:hypothetical protein
MAALARVVHNRQGAADPEHNRRENNQQGGLHGDLATAGPPNLPRRQNYRGSNEPTVNARGTVTRHPGPTRSQQQFAHNHYIQVTRQKALKLPD